jgi:hypothetical protein
MTVAKWAAVAVLAGVLGVHYPCLADETGGTPSASPILGALAGAALPAAELGRQQARGADNINLNYTSDGALSDGAVRGNAIIGPSATGGISTTGSINNDTGITTVFQNSGNNSLFQQTTSINITMH